MRFLCLFATLSCLASSASAMVNSCDLSAWLPELPPFSHARGSRVQHVDRWLRHVHPGMSIAQVLVELGPPDWGISHRGRLRWAVDPRDGVLQYSAGGTGNARSATRPIRIYFDSQARVKRIEDNGVTIAQGRRVLLPDPLPRGVWWRR
jgi:hypothetical protein